MTIGQCGHFRRHQFEVSRREIPLGAFPQNPASVGGHDFLSFEDVVACNMRINLDTVKFTPQTMAENNLA
jgi:hypothetical protein